MAPALPAPRLGDRALFPRLAARAYLNHAAASPPSLLVERAIAGLLARYVELGSGAFFGAVAGRGELRGQLARLVGASPEEIALVSNTTSGVVDVALCYPWERGDSVVVFEGEFPTNVTPWLRAAELFGLSPVFLRAGDFEQGAERGLEALDHALARAPGRGVRLVAVSAVEFGSGFRMPLAEIAEVCRRRGAELFVDAIQALGAVPLDVEALGVDYLAAGGHKFLMGVEGAGVLYVRKGREAALRPHLAGWLSHEEPVRFLLEGEACLTYGAPLRRRADVFESGTLPALPFAALGASVGALLELGVPAIFAHVSAYLDALEAGLVARGFSSLRSLRPEGRSAILSVRPPEGISVLGLSRRLGELGLVCATPNGVLRFSPHFPNPLSEVDLALGLVDEALASISSGGR